MKSTAGASPLLTGQTSIDDVLEQPYDLTPQFPLHWGSFVTGQRLHTARNSGGASTSSRNAEAGTTTIEDLGPLRRQQLHQHLVWISSRKSGSRRSRQEGKERTSMVPTSLSSTGAAPIAEGKNSYWPGRFAGLVPAPSEHSESLVEVILPQKCSNVSAARCHEAETSNSFIALSLVRQEVTSDIRA